MLIAVAVTVSAVSCLKKHDEPPIYIISPTHFVLQEPTEDGNRFLPHFGFWYGGKEEFASGQILLNDVPMSGYTHDATRSIFQINPAANAVTSLSELSGTYTYGPTGKNGGEWIRSFSVEFTEDNVLGDVIVTEFKCKDGKVSATFDKTAIGNIVAFGFYLQPFDNSSPTTYYAIPFNQYLTFPRSLTAATTETVGFYPNQLTYRAEKFRVTPAAFNYTGTTITVMRLAVGQDGTTNVYQDITLEDMDDFSKDFTPEPVEP